MFVLASQEDASKPAQVLIARRQTVAGSDETTIALVGLAGVPRFRGAKSVTATAYELENGVLVDEEPLASEVVTVDAERAGFALMKLQATKRGGVLVLEIVPN